MVKDRPFRAIDSWVSHELGFWALFETSEAFSLLPPVSQYR